MNKTWMKISSAIFFVTLCLGIAQAEKGAGDVALKVWNSPDFQKQFAESYMAETEIEPRVTMEEREQMQEILALISSDKLLEAAGKLEGEIQRNPAVSAVYDFTLANIYFQQEDYDKAAGIYETAVEKFPKFRRAWKNLGLIYTRNGDYEKAVPALTKVVELGGSDSISYGLLGFAYTNTGKFLSAESAYRMAILLDPETMDWQMGLARSFFKLERYADAVALCQKLVEEHPDRTDLWLLQANAYIGSEQPLKAAEIYELVDQMGQSSPESLNMLGDIYINEKLYSLAADAYLRAMDTTKSNNPDRAVRSAKILVARGAFEETKALIAKIQSKFGGKMNDMSRKELLKMEARIAVAEGGGDEEVRVLKEIVELDPLDGEALILLGQHYGRHDDKEKAEFYYERAANIDKYEADAKVRHAQLLVQHGQYHEALPLLRRAQQVEPRENIQEYMEQVERVAKGR